MVRIEPMPQCSGEKRSADENAKKDDCNVTLEILELHRGAHSHSNDQKISDNEDKNNLEV
jgi:hypothetical protein